MFNKFKQELVFCEIKRRQTCLEERVYFLASHFLSLKVKLKYGLI